MTLAVVAAYCVGSVPFALLVAGRCGSADLRAIGSGNPGATNVMRAYGVTAGLLVALLDIAKGAAGVLVAAQMSGTAAVPAAAGVAAVVGHVYPVWFRCRGGKGVATACGAFAVLAPAAVPAALLLFVIAVWLTRYISLGSVLAAIALPPLAYASGSTRPVVIAAIATAALIVFRHRSNLARVLARTERRIGARA
jgi:glycerol-3-phosphate acyltransferase PlsY